VPERVAERRAAADKAAITSIGAVLAAEPWCSADPSRVRTITAWIVAGLAALIWPDTLAASQGHAGGDYLAVEVSYEADPDPRLAFTVRSKLSESFVMYEADLPWGNANSVELSFEKASGDEPCPLYLAALDDPGDLTVEIMPGDVLKGDVTLADTCPAIKEVLAQSGVTVKWHYRPVHGGTYTMTDHGEFTLERTSRE
jgi:hypothetical protein